MRTSLIDRMRRHVKKWKIRDRYPACLESSVRDTINSLIYDEPTVMWRMRRGDGQTARAVIGSHVEGAILVWFVNDRPAGYRTFDDWSGALRWSEQLQAQNWAVGWRLEP